MAAQFQAAQHVKAQQGVAQLGTRRCAGVETKTVSSGGAFGSQEAPEKTNSYYVNSCQNLTSPCNAAEYVQGNGIFLQAASATVICSHPEERPRRTRGRRTTRKDHKRTTRDDEKGTRKGARDDDWCGSHYQCSLLYFVKMFYYYFVMSEVVQREYSDYLASKFYL